MRSILVSAIRASSLSQYFRQSSRAQFGGVVFSVHDGSHVFTSLFEVLAIVSPHPAAYPVKLCDMPQQEGCSGAVVTGRDAGYPASAAEIGDMLRNGMVIVISRGSLQGGWFFSRPSRNLP